MDKKTLEQQYNNLVEHGKWPDGAKTFPHAAFLLGIKLAREGVADLVYKAFQKDVPENRILEQIRSFGDK